ncbi:MAG: hypothetical protein AAF434_14475 [Pseudomonadota bacterium]
MKMLRRYILTALIAMCVCPATVAPGNAQSSTAILNIVGKWGGQDSDGDAVTMIFNEDESAEVLFEGLPRLSASNLVGGRVLWILDATQNPAQLDIVIYKHGLESGRLKMILQFKNDRTLEIMNSRDMKTRPVSFEISDSVYQILLQQNN